MIVPEQLKLVVEDLGAFVPRLIFMGKLILGLAFERQPNFRIRPTKDADSSTGLGSRQRRFRRSLGASPVSRRKTRRNAAASA